MKLKDMTFEDIKIGERVFTVSGAWFVRGTIINVSRYYDSGKNFRVMIQIDHGRNYWYLSDQNTWETVGNEL